jgi:Ser/Thr protein kinase RdoA (MazF antagonist)
MAAEKNRVRDMNGTTGPLARLAAGASSEVYALSDALAVKLFKPGFPREAIELELRHARIAQALGLPTPAVQGLVSLDGRSGIVFERCDGPTLYDAIVARTRPAEELAGLLFDLQARIHACPSVEATPIAQRLERRIAQAPGVSDAARRAALALVGRAVPEERFCHGDFHPLNVILAVGGARIIDWQDAGRGDPAADVVRTLLALQHARPGSVDAVYRAAFLRAYMARVRAAWGARLDRVERWGLPVAVARLAERIDDAERAALASFVAGFDTARPVAAA